MAFVTKHPDATLKEIGTACGLTPSDPAQGASKILKSETVQQRMAALMEKRPSLQDEALLIKMEEGLQAQETKFFAHEGEVQDERTVTDFPTRRGYLELALKLKGAMREQRELSGPGGGPIPMGGAPIPALLDMSKDELLRFVKATNG